MRDNGVMADPDPELLGGESSSPGGRQLNGFVQGRGSPVVHLPGLGFANGLPTGAARAFESALIGPLSAGQEVHWIGRRVGVPVGYTMADFADDYADEIRRRFDRPMPVVGFSTGGLLGLQLALDHPEVVDRLVVIGAGARLSDSARASDRRWIAALEQGRVADAWRALVVDATPTPRRAACSRRRLDAVGPWVTPADCSDGIRTARAEVDVDLTASAAGLRVPTLLVVGGRDPTSESAWRLAPGPRSPVPSCSSCPASGHLGSMVHPRTTIGSAVPQPLSDHAGPGRAPAQPCGRDDREQDGVADAQTGQVHDQPVDAQAHAAGRRHPVLQGIEEVLVDLHGLDVAGRGHQRLGDEALALVDRVDELGVGGALLRAEDDQVPLLGQPRVHAVGAGQWGVLLREVGVEHRGGGLALAQLAVELLEGEPPGQVRLELQPDPARRAACSTSTGRVQP